MDARVQLSIADVLREALDHRPNDLEERKRLEITVARTIVPHMPIPEDLKLKRGCIIREDEIKVLFSVEVIDGPVVQGHLVYSGSGDLRMIPYGFETPVDRIGDACDLRNTVEDAIAVFRKVKTAVGD